MTEIFFKLPDNRKIPVSVLEKYENTYKIQYTDPDLGSIHRFWTHEANLIFPQFSELVF